MGYMTIQEASENGVSPSAEYKHCVLRVDSMVQKNSDANGLFQMILINRMMPELRMDGIRRNAYMKK